MSLTIDDYTRAAAKLGVEVASVRAIAATESSGKGFFQDGRPVILYERHIFFRELLQKRSKAAKARVKDENPTFSAALLETKTATELRAIKIAIDQFVMQKPDICNTATGGYVGGVKEYDRLERAKAIDEECALRACSWGAFQVMGFHAEFLGFKDVFEMVETAKTEAGQLEIFVRFILKNPQILKALKAKNWPMVAQYYNGNDYAKNKYDTKLAAAYKTYTANPNLA